MVKLLFRTVRRNWTWSPLLAETELVKNPLFVVKLRTSLVRLKVTWLFWMQEPVALTNILAVSEVLLELLELANAVLVNVAELQLKLPLPEIVAVKVTIWLEPAFIVPKLKLVEPELRNILPGRLSVTLTFWAWLPLAVTWIWN